MTFLLKISTISLIERNLCAQKTQIAPQITIPQKMFRGRTPQLNVSPSQLKILYETLEGVVYVCEGVVYVCEGVVCV